MSNTLPKQNILLDKTTNLQARFKGVPCSLYTKGCFYRLKLTKFSFFHSLALGYKLRLVRVDKVGREIYGTEKIYKTQQDFLGEWVLCN